MSGKDVFSQWLRKKDIDRYLFIPLITNLAAKISNSTYDEMTTDSSKLAKTLIDCQKLFGYDGIIISFDNVIIAEALGCQVDLNKKQIIKRIFDTKLFECNENISKSERIQRIISGMTNIQKVTRNEVVCASISGIGKLQASIFHPDEDILNDQYSLLQKVMMNMIKAILEKRPDLLIIYGEENDALKSDIWEETYRPILNLIKYFRIPCVLVTENSVKLTLNCPSATVLSLTMNKNKSFEELCDEWNQLKTTPSVLLTAGELPVTMDVDGVHDLIDILQS